MPRTLRLLLAMMMPFRIRIFSRSSSKRTMMKLKKRRRMNKLQMFCNIDLKSCLRRSPKDQRSRGNL